MSNYTYAEKKSRGSQILSSCSAVVETPHQGTQGNLVTSFFLDGSPKLARGEKKVSSFEENEKDFSQKRTALLDKQKQLDIFKEEAHLKRLSMVSIFEQRGYFRQSDLLNECQTRMIYYECADCG
ncbi:unnamed protein product, partial [marine sediment metagenome]